MSPLIGIYASEMSANLFEPTGSYDALASVTVGTSVSQISFAGIPTGYKHLQVRFISRSTISTYNQVSLQFNSDTASNYSVHLLLTDGGSTVTAYGGANATMISVGMQTGSGNGASIYGASVVDVLDYSNTNKFKTTRGLAGADGNGSGYVWYSSGNWRSTSAITSIQLIPETGNFTTNSSFALYGVK